MANLFHPLTNFNQTLILSRHTILPIPDIETQPENIATSSMLLLLPLLRGTRQNTLFTVGSSLLSCYGARTVSGFEAFLHWLNYTSEKSPRNESHRIDSNHRAREKWLSAADKANLRCWHSSTHWTKLLRDWNLKRLRHNLCFASFRFHRRTKLNRTNRTEQMTDENKTRTQTEMGTVFPRRRRRRYGWKNKKEFKNVTVRLFDVFLWAWFAVCSRG